MCPRWSARLCWPLVWIRPLPTITQPFLLHEPADRMLVERLEHDYDTALGQWLDVSPPTKKTLLIACSATLTISLRSRRSNGQDNIKFAMPSIL